MNSPRASHRDSDMKLLQCTICLLILALSLQFTRLFNIAGEYLCLYLYFYIREYKISTRSPEEKEIILPMDNKVNGVPSRVAKLEYLMHRFTATAYYHASQNTTAQCTDAIAAKISKAVVPSPRGAVRYTKIRDFQWKYMVFTVYFFPRGHQLIYHKNI